MKAFLNRYWHVITGAAFFCSLAACREKERNVRTWEHTNIAIEGNRIYDTNEPVIKGTWDKFTNSIKIESNAFYYSWYIVPGESNGWSLVFTSSLHDPEFVVKMKHGKFTHRYRIDYSTNYEKP